MKLKLTSCLIFCLFFVLPAFLYAAELSGGLFREKRGYYSSVGSTMPTSALYSSTGFSSYVSGYSQTSNSFRHQSGFIPTYQYPRRIVDLVAFTGEFPGEVHAQFSAPGAAGNIVKAEAYEVRYSTEMPVNNETAWELASPSTGFANPLNPDSVQTEVLSGLIEGATYYIAVRARDRNNNRGEVSNSPSGATQRPIVDISISGADYDFGTFTEVTSSVAAVSSLVSNTGNAPLKYTLHATTATAGTPWMLGATPGVDVAVVQAVFHPARPTDAQYSSEDVVVAAGQLSQTTGGGGRYTIDDSQTGVNVTTNTVRNLWMRFLTPLSTSTTDQQGLTLTVTAQVQ